MMSRAQTHPWVFAGIALLVVALMALLTIRSTAKPASKFVATVDLPDEQQLVSLPIRVIDKAGKPVAKAKVLPWALRSSQGHGLWREDPKERSGLSPQEAVTDARGHATIGYPFFRDAKERTRTLAISLWVDHPDHAYLDDLHIDVPLTDDSRYEIELQPGATVELVPTLDGKPAPLAEIKALSSDGRSWRPGYEPQPTGTGAIRFPTMLSGPAAIRLVRIENGVPTHFSPLVRFDTQAGETINQPVEMQPAVIIRGRLDGVDGPVRDGRVKLWTLQEDPADPDCTWMSWAPVAEDDTFSLPWPAEEPAQLIALCDSAIATSGAAPEVVKNPRDNDPFQRPHVFTPAELREEIIVPMEPLVPCEVAAVDEQGMPLPDIRISACPNVCWWNGGSQIYASPLVRGETLLIQREYQQSVDRETADEFVQTTDADGKATLHLPIGEESLYAGNDDYELPVAMGRRHIEINLVPGRTKQVRLTMQPTGTEQLGDWDRLAGVVFGCSTREGRRLCALPSVKQEIDKFRRLLANADDPRDPAILSEAYEVVAKALENAGDPEEATKWRNKAAKQRRLASQ